MTVHLIVKRITFCALVFSLCSHLVSAQQPDTAIGDRWQKYIDLKRYSKFFWKTDTIFDETAQAVNDNGAVSVKLLFKAREILSVKTANYGKEFLRGKDWDLKDGRLIILPSSSIPFIRKEDLVFKTYKPGLSMTGKTEGTFVLFTEKPYFSALQIAVTYVKEKSEKWKGYKPGFSGSGLVGTYGRLKSKLPLKIVFYGNSIEAGYNTSDHMGTAPYMPSWPELIVYNLRQYYGNNITYSNQAVAGKLASWGLEEVSAKVIPEKPDLVIIGFGMNDGAANVTRDKYRQDIEGIVKKVTKENPATEFVLIAPMLPNPDAVQNGIQASYRDELYKLAGRGIVVADMTSVHSELLKHKLYQDMTGNNVNHPNDYLARWYAQVILRFLVKKI